MIVNVNLVFLRTQTSVCNEGFSDRRRVKTMKSRWFEIPQPSHQATDVHIWSVCRRHPQCDLCPVLPSKQASVLQPEFILFFVIVAFNKSLLWCIRVDDICTWIVIDHVKKCLDFVFVFLKMNGNGVFFPRSLSVRKNAHSFSLEMIHITLSTVETRSLYLLLSKTLIEINILYFSLTSATLMSVIMILYKWK